MPLIATYTLREILKNGTVIIMITIVALLLERSLRIVEIVGPSDRLLDYSFQMLINLVPHYFGIALPTALFGGVRLTFNRMKRDGELDVLHAAGIGLHQLILPVIGMSLLIMAFAAILFGYLQPYARYQYRFFLHQAEESSIIAAFKVGTFIHADNMTFYIEDASRGVEDVGKIFIHEEGGRKEDIITTAERGLLDRGPDQSELFLVARNGQKVDITREGDVKNVLTFGNIRQRVLSFTPNAFRKRGGNEREMTLPELWAARKHVPPTTTAADIRAEFHGRIAQIVTLILLPLIAVPLALGGGRGGQAYGIVIGIAILIVFEQILLFGEAIASKGLISPWLSIWSIVAVFALTSIALFMRAAFRICGDPYALLNDAVQMLLSFTRGQKTPQQQAS